MLHGGVLLQVTVKARQHSRIAKVLEFVNVDVDCFAESHLVAVV